MNADQIFWVKIWCIVAICFITFVSSILINSLYDSYAVSSAKDPMRTACAMGYGSSAVCVNASK